MGDHTCIILTTGKEEQEEQEFKTCLDSILSLGRHRLCEILSQKSKRKSFKFRSSSDIPQASYPLVGVGVAVMPIFLPTAFRHIM